MPDLASVANEVRGLPDQVLRNELTNPSGVVPGYLILAEAQRRQLMRQASQKEQAQQSGGSVYDDVLRGMLARSLPTGLPPGPAGMTPLASLGGSPSPARVPGSTPPNNFQVPPQRMADGGEVEDSSFDPTDEEQAVLDQIKKHESGGDYTIQNRPLPGQQPSSASGAYQFINSTWQNAAKHTGIGTEFTSAKDAPRSAQDANALWLLRQVGPNSPASWGGPQGPQGGYPVPTAPRYQAQLSAPPALAGVPTAPAQPVVSGTPAPQPVPPIAPPPPSTPSDPEKDDVAQFTTTATAPVPARGRIGQRVDEYQKLIDDLQGRIGNLPDPYSQANIQKTAQTLAPALFGVPADYLQNLSQVAELRKATIKQLQDDALNRYQRQNPFEMLGNIAAGMAQSKSVNGPAMFAEGVGYAVKQRDANREQALSDYDALAKEAETIDSNIDTVRQRMGTAIGNVLDRQDALAQSNRNTLQTQLDKLRVEQDKWSGQLNPKNPFQVLSNPDDYDATAIKAARDQVNRLHPEWNNQRQAWEQSALELLAQAKDPFDPTKYKSALDQLNDKHQDLAGQVRAAPKAAAYTPQQLDLWVEAMRKDPHSLWNGSVPKAAIPAVQQEGMNRGYAVPIVQPNKQLADQAALSTTALLHVDNVARYAADPWFQANVIGPIEGRLQKGLGVSGFEVPGATPQQTRDVQDFLSSITYLFMREGKALFGGRPPEKLMQELQQTTPGAQMAPARLLGALDAVRQSANMAIAADRGYMMGGTSARPIIAIPPGGKTGVDSKSGRKVMTPGVGQPWYYMDDGSEWKR